MKKALLFTAFAFISIASFSQDIISLKKGRRVEVIITEITPTLVRYRLFSEPNGKVYFTYKDDIAGIMYKDGRVINFDQPAEQTNVEQTTVKQTTVKQTTESAPKVNENRQSNSLNPNQKNVETTTPNQPVKKAPPTETKSQNWADDKSQSDKEIYYNSLNRKNSKPVPNRDSQNAITLNEESEFHSGYRGIVDFGYYMGIGKGTYDYSDKESKTGIKAYTSPSHFNFDFINGLQINPRFFVGIGTGIHAYMNPSERSFPKGLMILPVFVNFRVNLLNTKVSPYASVDLGYSLNAKEKFGTVGALGGATLGVNFRITDKLGIHVGANYQAQFHNVYYEDVKSLKNMGAIGLTMGVSF